MRDEQRTTSEDNATQLLICEALSLATCIAIITHLICTYIYLRPCPLTPPESPVVAFYRGKEVKTQSIIVQLFTNQYLPNHCIQNSQKYFSKNLSRICFYLHQSSIMLSGRGFKLFLSTYKYKFLFVLVFYLVFVFVSNH